ncbi:acyl-CoA dehydrogenase family protein [Rhodococcus sp. NPDC127530]|uniref:acyl-CoA dehydrogenase family protein n=1 Tax=unclassified Rhodococcus (in: high G+C Gram-positive bacteria) TaxID=192944 RepID=UPI0036281CC3
MWNFSTEPEFEEQLEWMRRFVVEEVAPLDLLWPHDHHRTPPKWLKEVIDPLKDEVRKRGLWACHLGPELGGQGFGQVKLSLMNEILAPYQWAPTIFGVQGPDTGNAEVIAHYGTQEQKDQYLQPLLDGELFSAFSMTEPQGGSDPTGFRCRAERDGDGWVINGEKFFTSNSEEAAFLVLLAVTDPEASTYKRMSMFLVPRDTPGIETVRRTQFMGEAEDAMDHALVRYTNVRVPAEGLLGEPGQGFEIAQTRLSGGRIHHAMRGVGQARYAFDMGCERVLSRISRGSQLGDFQLVQQAIMESYAQIEQFRLFVLRTAWMIDQGHGYSKDIRRDIAVAKVLSARVVRDVVERAMHLHGALGVSNEMPFGELWALAAAYGIWDGPTEVHTITAARLILQDHEPAPGDYPTEWLPARVEAARAKHATALAAQAATEAKAHA